MWYSENWKEYELIDCGRGAKLERWGDQLLVRPDPQAIWSRSDPKNPHWLRPDGRYIRSKSGGGAWSEHRLPELWQCRIADLDFNVKPMGFKHTGLFPEQAVNWDWMAGLIKNAGRPIRVLNLFGYTGGATLACAAAGAHVTHVDAAKGMVQWAKENAVASDVADKNVRWLVDDCLKFVKREIRRGKKYDAIIMDPPSYGRGPNGEVWKLEQQLTELLTETGKLLSDDAIFFFLNSYTGGLSPTILNYMVKQYIVDNRGGEIFTDEIGLRVSENGLILPCGSTAIWMK